MGNPRSNVHEERWWNHRYEKYLEDKDKFKLIKQVGVQLPDWFCYFEIQDVFSICLLKQTFKALKEGNIICGQNIKQEKQNGCPPEICVQSRPSDFLR